MNGPMVDVGNGRGTSAPIGAPRAGIFAEAVEAVNDARAARGGSAAA
jgi:hypothetical protein